MKKKNNKKKQKKSENCIHTVQFDKGTKIITNRISNKQVNNLII